MDRSLADKTTTVASLIKRGACSHEFFSSLVVLPNPVKGPVMLRGYYGFLAVIQMIRALRPGFHGVRLPPRMRNSRRLRGGPSIFKDEQV